MNTSALAVFLSILFVVTSMLGQESSVPQSYTDKDAYQIYDLLIPNEEIWGTKTRVIQQETVRGGGGMMDIDSCVSPEVSHDFQDAIVSFKAANSRRWLLQRQFAVDRPYELISSNAIEATFKAGEQNSTKSEPPIAVGWRRFYERYPGSGGFIVLSAVGFNNDKSRAVVYSGASCGALCGRWSFHLFKKVNGTWTEAPGITCHTIS